MQFADAYIELVEMFPCANRFELQGREGELIRTTECVNKAMPGRTRAEYNEDNRETISVRQHKYNKQYYEDNKESIKQCSKQYNNTHREETKQYYKQYRQNTKNIRKCSCGREFNDGRTDSRNSHYGSDHHVKFVQDFYDRLHSLLVPENE